MIFVAILTIICFVVENSILTFYFIFFVFLLLTTIQYSFNFLFQKAINLFVGNEKALSIANILLIRTYSIITLNLLIYYLLLQYY